MKKIFTFFFCLFAVAAMSQQYYLLVGTYTNTGSKGIYVYKFNTATGKVEALSNVVADNPSYLVVAPGNKFVYSVSESGSPTRPGSVNAYSFNKGILKDWGKTSSKGDNPCFIDVDNKGTTLAVANYSSGNLALIPIGTGGAIFNSYQTVQHTGSSINASRQEKSHVHQTLFSKDNSYLFVSDLGTDEIRIYPTERNQSNFLQLIEKDVIVVSTAKGVGPRHVAPHPYFQTFYSIEELSGKVTAYSLKNKKVKVLQTIAADTVSKQPGSADIHISQDGKFLYASNRASANSIAIYSIDKKGLLKQVGLQSVLGDKPRNFSLDPTGDFLFVANQGTDNIVIFKRDRVTGLLSPTGQTITVNKPVCLQWIPVEEPVQNN